jgi:hypothetical protein
MGNQLETIQKLYAKTKTYEVTCKIEGKEEKLNVEIKPLSLDDMEVLQMGEDMPLSELSKNAKILFSKSLGITEDEASKISFEYMEALLLVIMEANNFKEEDMKKTGIKDFIKQKQEQMKKAEEKPNVKSN